MTNNTNAILEGLNEEQKKAVQCVEGPVLIVAGAGSGKTKVLTSRVANIVAQGVEPWRILALTFTKKAAGEMKERIALMVGTKAAKCIVMGTFHAVFVRFLREYSDSIGFPSSFTISDTSDSQSCIRACVKELGLDDKVYKAKDVLSRISMAKNNLVTVSSYRTNEHLLADDARRKQPRLVDIYELYQKKLKQAAVMDFDDILVNMNILFRDNKEALESIQARFSYIMVDEYQDTNNAQYIILKKLAAVHHNLCVVGDDSQSIYAFRGARIENILNFKKDYPEYKIFRLERNYRSTQNIVKAANSVIAHNEGRIPKQCFSLADSGDKIKLINTFSESEETMMIVSEIMARMRKSGAEYNDFAILYRTNAQSRALEEQLRRRNLPYMIYSGNSFFDRMEVKDVMAYFKLCVNPNDDESFKRVVNKPARAIGDTSVSALNECARAHGCSLFKAVFQEDTLNYGLRAAAREKILAFCKLISDLGSLVPTTDAYELAKKIVDESGIFACYKFDTSVEGLARTANIEELVNSVQAFVEEREEELDPEENQDAVFTLDDYLENTALLSNVDTDVEDSSNRIALMTVHSSKGLEFPYVFITGLEENLFPSLSMLSSKSDLEEERRLFYVAVTRAKEAVYLSFAATRMRNGKHEENRPSRFIYEIDRQYIENPLKQSLTDASGIERMPFSGGGFRFGSGKPGAASQPKAFSRPSGTQVPSKSPAGISRSPLGGPKPEVVDPNFVAVPMDELYEGEIVEHNRFGRGVIKQITGKTPEKKAVINFDDYGEKLLLLKFAKLRPAKK